MTDRDQDKDELFEDLDKFFAPIQDVEWPEHDDAVPAAAPPAQAPASADEPTTDDEDPFAAPDEPVDPAGRPERQVDIYAEVEEGADAPFSERAAGDEPADDGSSVVEGIRVRPIGQPSAEPDPGVSVEGSTGDLFEEPTGELGGASDAAGWPFPAEAEVEVVDETDIVDVVEPVDAAPVEPVAEGPDVEAAAEHFATSVRAETGEEPPAPGPGDGLGDLPATDEPALEPYLTEEMPTQQGTEAEQVEVYETETVVGEPYDTDRPFAAETEVERSLLADLDEGEGSDPVVVGGEGPSWQEPTSVEVGGVEESGRGGRDMPAAFLTGVVLVAIALLSLAIGRGVFALVASALVLLAQGELYAVMQKRHLQPATIVGLVTGALVLAAGYFHGEPAMLAMLALGTIATFLWYMTIPPAHRKHLVVAIGSTMLPVVYVSLLAGYALITLSLDALDGRALMISVIALTFIYDTAAFAFGSVWGSRPLAQSISPKKSWEGAIAATLTLIVAAGILSSLVDPLDTIQRSIGLAIVVAIFAPLGDLAESLMKRDLDVKDMGSILPGHGGVLDRIDSLLFVAPAAFLYFRIFL
ncbi:MAG: phosphatidate cytidylyltransferase [Actinomycetota bacterium]